MLHLLDHVRQHGLGRRGPEDDEQFVLDVGKKPQDRNRKDVQWCQAPAERTGGSSGRTLRSAPWLVMCASQLFSRSRTPPSAAKQRRQGLITGPRAALLLAPVAHFPR